jgi:hypothetical protein
VHSGRRVAREADAGHFALSSFKEHYGGRIATRIEERAVQEESRRVQAALNIFDEPVVMTMEARVRGPE